MKIIYGVVGEGMGHATRSRVTIEHLLSAGHRLHIVVSGRAHQFLRRLYDNHAQVSIQEIHGLSLNYSGNSLDLFESIISNVSRAPLGILENIVAYGKTLDSGFVPDLVISDFESWAYLYALNNRIPVVSIDNMQVLNRCCHDDDVTGGQGGDYLLAKAAVQFKLPQAYHYLISSFFFPPVRKKRTSLIPPILRPEILAARREPGEHVLVYQTAASNQGLVPLLNKLPYKFRVYGMGREGEQGNVSLRPFSQDAFVDDLRCARAVIAGGGYSLMGEAVHLRVPMLSVPIDGQYEQELNARYLAKLGYGTWARSLDADNVQEFIASSDHYRQGLERYQPQDNSMLYACVDELLHLVELDEPRPPRLSTQVMASFDDDGDGSCP